MPEVMIQGKTFELNVSDSTIRAFVKLAEAYFSLPGVCEDFERWCREEDEKQNQDKK